VDIQLDTFSDTVGLIYEAGLDPDRWPVALEVLCNELRADKAQILYLDTHEHKISFASSFGFDPFSNNINAARFRKYFASDPVAQYGITHLNEVFSDRRVIDTEALHASGMHQDIRRPEDMEYLLTTFLSDGSNDWSGICFFRKKEQDSFNKKDEAALVKYTDHLRRSTYIHKSVSGAAYFKTIQNAVLDDLDTGIIVVDELHDVVLCNKSARATIDNNGVFRQYDSRLKCHHTRENALLHNSIDEALSYHPETSSNRRIAVRLTGEDRNKSILAVTTQLQIQKLVEKRQNLQLSKAHYTARIPSRKNALITLCDPKIYKNNPVEMLEQLFGLTPAESALAECLADDYSLNAAAKMLGRSVGTARVQLQSVFEKTDTNRQSSLIRLIMSVP
jgi:DNA-binding CsgD family transcriptional regulator